ncbi:kelch repeat and BTB domain-containing protein 13-like [Paroedura picta]|uniref:kelch repeat and BTB domain-containing protein 13-like n=1 Tax=Paroedura picta TaxID=143630 RepID=UPI00405790FE
MPPRGLRAASGKRLSGAAAWLAWARLTMHVLAHLSRALRQLWALLFPSQKWPGRASGSLPEPWESCPEQRVYRGGDPEGKLLMVHTWPYSFQVDLAPLAEESAYFQALSRSGMQEAAEGHLRLDHVPSGAFHAILQWVFGGRFGLQTEEDLLPAVQAASYLVLPGFLDRCWVALRPLLGPQNCLSLLHFAEAVGCPELQAEVCGYLSANLLELAAPVTRHLAPQLREKLARLRLQGPPQLCVLQKESLTTAGQRGLYCRPLPPEEGGWHCATHLPFQAEKWSFSTAQLLNYLFIMGGYREKRGARGFIFRMAAFRYNPLTGVWHPTAAPQKRRRHFGTAVVAHHIYAIGGWYLGSLLAPDSSTCLYAAVERYDPWADRWAFVSSLPTGGFSFAISLSHDLPLCTAHARAIYTLGTVQRTGEKLLLRYDVGTDSWQELLPTLTQADADLPGLYFLGGTEPLFVVGSNSRGNVVTSFSVASCQWGPVRALPKCGLAGQGLAVEGLLYMASPDLGAILVVDLAGPDCTLLPPPPFPLCYESLFLLHFPLEADSRGGAGEQEGEKP